jgi:hypothetical protein
MFDVVFILGQYFNKTLAISRLKDIGTVVFQASGPLTSFSNARD